MVEKYPLRKNPLRKNPHGHGNVPVHHNYLYYDPLRAQASGHWYGNHFPDV